MSYRARPSRNRWQPRALMVVGAAAALFVGAATAAQAHNTLVRTSPANGAIVKVVPAQVMLTFNEPALAIGTEIIVTGPAGEVQTGVAVLVDSNVTEHLQPGSPAGRYRVVWRVTSADGHLVTGAFSFIAESASPGQRPTATSAITSAPGGPSEQSRLGWIVAGGVVVVLLLVVLIRARKPGTTSTGERDHEG